MFMRIDKYSYSINNKFYYGGRLKNLIIFEGFLYKLFLFILIFAPILDYLVTCRAINILGINTFLYYETSILKYKIVNNEWYFYFIIMYLLNVLIYYIYNDALKNTLNLYNLFIRYICFFYSFYIISLPILSWEFLYFKLGY